MYSLAPFVWVITCLVVICFVVSLMVSGFELKSNGTLGLAALLWVVYSFYETFIFDLIDSGLLEVRVDVLFIFPTLLGITAFGLIRWMKRLGSVR